MLVNGVLSLSISLHDLETTMNASRGSLRLMRTRHVTRAPVCCCCQLVFVQFTLDTLAKTSGDTTVVFVAVAAVQPNDSTIGLIRLQNQIKTLFLKHGFSFFLSRVSTLTRDIDIANLSVRLSVRL